MFNPQVSDHLVKIIEKLKHKDPVRLKILRKKITEILACDINTIQRYKNLRHDLSDLKRVHIDSHFVLTFGVYTKDNIIQFVDLQHHDNAY